MTHIFGMLRVKNEARWIGRVIDAIFPFCEQVLVLDDHSDDETAAICRKRGCLVFDSPFADFHEARDKDYLLARAWQFGAEVNDYCLMLDGDEELVAEDAAIVKATASAGKLVCGTLKVLYLWDSPTTMRVDRWYQDVRRQSFFKLTARDLTFRRTEFGGNMHCSNAPAALLCYSEPTPIRLLHYGYLYKEDRIRKYHWYNAVDPNNDFEDRYRHMVVGDLFPADAMFKWAGPLKVVAL